ncbi:MAG TPA: extracellular solute-binding protein, partial [Chloroflexota bacterium]|nr:extracellular solute-binding protein [Chloroflexota bacterium]
KDKDVKKADFATNMWDTFTVKGKQYAIPREAGPTVLYYNKSILQGGGVETPGEPWTMSGKYREAAVKLTTQDRSVIGTHLGNWRNWVYSAGGDVVDAQELKYVLDQQKAVDGLQLYQDFRYRFNAATTPQENTEQGFIERFIAGGLAMTAGVRSAGNNKGFVQPNVGIAQHPKGSAGRKFVMPGNGLAIVQPNTAPEASWDVVKWYTSPEFQKMHYSMGIGGVVARSAVLKSEEYLTSSIPREWNEFFAKGVPDLTVPPKLPNWNEILGKVNSELAEFENGRETARAATTRISPILNALLAENASWVASK